MTTDHPLPQFAGSESTPPSYAGSTNTASCANSPAGGQPFAYDAADNLTKIGSTIQQFNPADELCWTNSGTSANACGSAPVGARTYSYDTRGNRTNAVPSSGPATCDAYDQADRLTSIRTGTGPSCGSPVTVGTYRYNGDGLRMSKTVGVTTTNALWDLSGALPLQIQDGSTYYIFGPNHMPLEQINGSTTLWYHHDQIGSTRTVTDNVGNSAATFVFDPYGNLTASTGSVTTPFLFAGEYRDFESHDYYLRARYYDPATAQFLTVDPAAVATRSPYAYVNGNPLNGTDPTGLFCYPWQLFNGQCDYQIHAPSLDQLEQNRQALKGTFLGSLIRFDPLVASAEDVNARWHGATDVSNGDLLWDAVGVAALPIGIWGESWTVAGNAAMASYRSLSWWHFLAKPGFWLKGQWFTFWGQAFTGVSSVSGWASNIEWLWSDLQDWTIHAC